MVVVVAIMLSKTNTVSEQSRARFEMYVFREHRQILMALVRAAAEQSCQAGGEVDVSFYRCIHP